MRSKLAILIAGCLMMAAAFNIELCRADTVGDATSIIDGIVMYKMNECGAADISEWIAADIAPNAGNGSDAYAWSLAKLDGSDLDPYVAQLREYLASNEVRSATTRLKYALCLMLGDGSDAYIRDTADEATGGLGIMSLAYGLHLYSNGVESAAHPHGEIINDILALRHDDGGWSVMGDYGDVDVTAMVLQSFAGYLYAAGDTDEDFVEAVREAAEDGLDFLSSKQLADGGYAGFGSANSESTAQVLIALSSLRIDAADDPAFIKNGHTIFDALEAYRQSDGSYSHTADGGSDPTATTQVFSAMVSYVCMKLGMAPFYVYEVPVVDTEGAEGLKTAEGTDGPETPEGVREAEKPETAGESETAEGTEDAKGRSETAGSADPESGKAGIADAVSENSERGTSGSFGGNPYRTVIYIIIAALAAAACVFFTVTRRRDLKNYLFVVIVAAALAFFAGRLDIKSPEEYYSADEQSGQTAAGTVTFAIRCDTITGVSDSEFIPADGIILEADEYAFYEGESVYDILVRVVREAGIHMERANSGAHSYYISGIGHIYEYEYGELSGWMYYVNGTAPSCSCGEYFPQDGDSIAWLYTREIGKDIEQR